MRKSSLFLALACIAGSLFMGSCMRKTLSVAASPVVGTISTVLSCANALINKNKNHHHHIEHAHVKKEEEVMTA